MSVRVCVAEARAVRVTAGTPAAAVSVTGPVVAAHGEEYTGPTTVTWAFPRVKPSPGDGMVISSPC